MALNVHSSAQIVLFAGLKFPNDEAAVDYALDLSDEALDILEYMEYPQEEYAMKRYMQMFNDYYQAKIKVLTGASFATKAASKTFAKKLRQGLEELEEEVEEEVQRSKGNGKGKRRRKQKEPKVKEDVARQILEFLFVYYLSYHEAEEKYGRSKKYDLKSFCTWFKVQKKKYAKANKAEVEELYAIDTARTGPDAQLALDQLKRGKRDWKRYHMQRKTLDRAKLKQHYNDMKHLINWSDNKIESVSWRVGLSFQGQDITKTQINKRYRIWSTFIHPDQNKGYTAAFQDHLYKRFNVLSTMRDNAIDEIEQNTVDLT